MQSGLGLACDIDPMLSPLALGQTSYLFEPLLHEKSQRLAIRFKELICETACLRCCSA